MIQAYVFVTFTLIIACNYVKHVGHGFVVGPFQNPLVCHPNEIHGVISHHSMAKSASPGLKLREKQGAVIAKGKQTA